ncbi:cytochrome b5 [Chironomus tepperi]|uniref:cytochrome b5 n=1 Tax=Chironomus tepperi TaxID=113505 RepID=UPI00391F4774
MEVLNSEIDAKETLVAATNFMTSTIRTLIFSPKTPVVEHAISNDDKLNQISLSDVALHDTPDDCWIVIYDRVYDVTNFFDNHPGGTDIILEYAGRDSSVAFAGHSNFALSMLKQYEIGILPPNERMYRYPATLSLSCKIPE